MLIDPGHDFGKNTRHSLEATRRLDELVATGWPVLMALSNKDFVGETLDVPLEERLTGTLAATAVSAWLGARVFRAHDVVATRQTLDMVASIRGDRPPVRTVRGLRMTALAVVAPDERTLHGWFDPALPPVLTVEPGTTVRFGTLDSGWGTGPWTGGPGAERPRHPAHVEGAGHALTGPVAVAGRAGRDGAGGRHRRRRPRLVRVHRDRFPADRVERPARADRTRGADVGHRVGRRRRHRHRPRPARAHRRRPAVRSA